MTTAEQLQARGQALAILKILDVRGLQIPSDRRQQILACTDIDQLDRWLRRAATAIIAWDFPGR